MIRLHLIVIIIIIILTYYSQHRVVIISSAVIKYQHKVTTIGWYSVCNDETTQRLLCTSSTLS